LNKPCFATGRGEILQQIDIDLSENKIVVVHPGIHISTAWAFATIKPSKPVKSIRQIFQQSITTWKDELINDFEKPVFAKYPEIKNIKDALYDAGAIYASMSGSGSAVYGIFKKEKTISLSFSGKLFCKNFIQLIATGHSNQVDQKPLTTSPFHLLAIVPLVYPNTVQHHFYPGHLNK
jgi:4-diphosphocytidyl-2-C-methyl-D-erythritol kinase